VPNTAIAAKIHQALDVHRRLPPKVALDDEVRYSRSQTGDFGFGKIFHDRFGFYTGRIANLSGARSTDAKDGRQSNHYVLVQRNVDACYSSHFTPFPLI
jgi:hypothetical protein